MATQPISAWCASLGLVPTTETGPRRTSWIGHVAGQVLLPGDGWRAVGDGEVVPHVNRDLRSVATFGPSLGGLSIVCVVQWVRAQPFMDALEALCVDEAL